MKYIVFKTEGGVFMPVIIPEHVTHAEVCLKGAIPDSAGFFSGNAMAPLVSRQGAESLKLLPKIERDTKLLRNTLLNSGMYAFIDEINDI